MGDARSTTGSLPIDSPCECEHNNPDSLDARLFFSVVLAVAPAVTMDEASSLSWYLWSERNKLCSWLQDTLKKENWLISRGIGDFSIYPARARLFPGKPG